MKLHNILVPIDFSNCSKNALRIAISLAKDFGSKIHMVNAVHAHPPHPDLVGGSLIDSILIDYENQVKQSFEELESEIIELKDVPHEADRFIAYLTDAIRTESELKNIDLIVMGTRAHHDSIEHLIGTRSSDIIETATAPVLVIPEGCTSFHPKKIGFASDMSEIKNYQKLKLINDLASHFSSEVMIFTIADNPEKLTTSDQKLIEELTKKFDGIDQVSARTVQSDSVTKGIVDFVGSHELDMLAMIPHRFTFFERFFKRSITKNIVVDITVPMLTFHE